MNAYLPLPRAALFLLLAAALAGCVGSGRLQDASPEAFDAAALLKQLDDRGLRVQPNGPTSGDLFSADGRRYSVGEEGDVIDVYEFEEAATAELEAQEADLQNLEGTPALYRRGRVVVVHPVAEAPAAAQGLEDVLGARLN